jgi:hypothetical protein
MSTIAMPDRYHEALYYAVRENFNACLPGKENIKFIDKKNDELIRAAIVYFETTKDGQRPPAARIAIESLADAAIRRGIHGKYRPKKENI